jgi:hypothetical protein
MKTLNSLKKIVKGFSFQPAMPATLELTATEVAARSIS